MRQSIPSVSANRLIQVAKEAGFTITRAQLERWHKAGLLPRPQQVQRPGVRGSVSEYPLHADEQLGALLELHATNRRLHAIGWGLWWQGWTVDLKYVRTPLRRALAEVETLQAAFQRMDAVPQSDDAAADAASNVLEATIAMHLRTAPSTQPSRQATMDLLRLILPSWVGAGTPPPEEHLEEVTADMRPPWSAFDVRDAAQWFQMLHTVMADADLRTLVEEASPEQLAIARDTFRVIQIAWSVPAPGTEPVREMGKSRRRMREPQHNFDGPHHPLQLLWMLAYIDQHPSPEVFGTLRELFDRRRPATLTVD